MYQRADLNKIILSQSVGPSCNLQQTVAAKKITEGAAVSLFLTEFERERECEVVKNYVTYICYGIHTLTRRTQTQPTGLVKDVTSKFLGLFLTEFERERECKFTTGARPLTDAG